MDFLYKKSYNVYYRNIIKGAIIMIIWGWGKVTKKFFGAVMQKQCGYCNNISNWQLCIMRTWFTLFFIPVIPYSKKYGIVCPNCGAYIEISKAEFDRIKMELQGEKGIDDYKYQGKNETQVNFLKTMEEAKNK